MKAPVAEIGSPARFNWKTILLLLIPILLLGGVIAVFLSTGGGLQLASSAPLESLVVERYVLRPGSIELQLRNNSPQALKVAQVVVNNAVMQFEMHPSTEIPRLGRASILIQYPWIHAEAYSLTVFTSNGIAFGVDIPIAMETPQPGTGTLLSFTLIGLYVGVIPIFLGLLWFPALRKMGRRTMIFLMAATAGLLIFLGLDTFAEALDAAGKVPSAFQGIGLLGIGAVATFMLLDAVSSRKSKSAGSDAEKRLSVALMIAVGIGIHNLGEGLAIGAAYNIGEIALGTFLVVGFIIQNITEGLGIIAPVLRDRPGIGRLAIMGLIGGAPAIVGAWIGGYSPSPFLTVLFLAIGTGAIFQVVFEIAKVIQRDVQREPMPMTVFGGVLTGMLMLWITGLLIK